MKQSRSLLLIVLISLPLVGCFSSQTPQATGQAAKQFSGGPMPADAQKKFQESMKKNKGLAQQNSPTSGKQ